MFSSIEGNLCLFMAGYWLDLNAKYGDVFYVLNN